MSIWNENQVGELINKTLTQIENNNNYELIFHCEDGSKYKMYHEQN